MKKKTNPQRILLNDEVLSFSVNVIKDMLKLNSSPNVMYGDKDIVFSPS